MFRYTAEILPYHDHPLEASLAELAKLGFSEVNLRISAHRGRRFRLIVDAISAGSWTAFQSDRGRRFSVIVDEGVSRK